MTYSFVAGNVLTAAQLNALSPVYAIKSANQNIISSATLTNDTDLKVTLVTGVTYRVEVRLSAFSAVTTNDIRVGYTFSGTTGGTGVRAVFGAQIATADVTATLMKAQAGFALTSGVTYGLDGLNNCGIWEDFIITATVGGVLQLQWAQAAIIATNTTVNSGSYIIATPIAM
jgi:hypothetical protein